MKYFSFYFSGFRLYLGVSEMLTNLLPVSTASLRLGTLTLCTDAGHFVQCYLELFQGNHVTTVTFRVDPAPVISVLVTHAEPLSPVYCTLEVRSL